MDPKSDGRIAAASPLTKPKKLSSASLLPTLAPQQRGHSGAVVVEGGRTAGGGSRVAWGGGSHSCHESADKMGTSPMASMRRLTRESSHGEDRDVAAAAAAAAAASMSPVTSANRFPMSPTDVGAVHIGTVDSPGALREMRQMKNELTYMRTLVATEVACNEELRHAIASLRSQFESALDAKEQALRYSDAAHAAALADVQTRCDAQVDAARMAEQLRASEAELLRSQLRERDDDALYRDEALKEQQARLEAQATELEELRAMVSDGAWRTLASPCVCVCV
jgi:hypothetical protein